MQITSPFGYGEIVPLEKHHKVLLPTLTASGGAAPAFVRTLNAMAISISEFAVAARDYPIVFSSTDQGRTFAPLVVLGLADRQNLFVDAEDCWVAGSYVPAFVRRYPFCSSTVLVDGVAQADRLVCIDRAYLDEGGIALFDADGAPSREWTERERLLSEYDADLAQTARMCATLATLDLFTPLTLEIRNDASGGEAARIGGMFGIDESRFVALGAEQHKALVAGGIAARVYAHLFSLANFARLNARAIAMRKLQAALRRA